MLKKNNKKGFTLIELVIVLAVLAIIALIAIPNFTKVKDNARTKADILSAKQIKKETELAIELGDIGGNGSITFNKGSKDPIYSPGIKKHDTNGLFKNVNPPNNSDIVVTIDGDNVTATHNDSTP